MTFRITEGHVFEKRLCFEKQSRENCKGMHRHEYNEQILAVIFGIQNEDKLFQSQGPNCVSTHTHTHTHIHTDTLHPEFITEVSYRHSIRTQRDSLINKWTIS